jgi:hypothetical protein
MSRDLVTQAAADRLRVLLVGQPGHEHLEVESRGRDLTVLTREEGQVVRLARLSALPAGRYGLSLMWHSGRWVRLPVVGTLDQVVQILRADYAEMLAPVGR